MKHHRTHWKSLILASLFMLFNGSVALVSCQSSSQPESSIGSEIEEMQITLLTPAGSVMPNSDGEGTNANIATQGTGEMTIELDSIGSGNDYPFGLLYQGGKEKYEIHEFQFGTHNRLVTIGDLVYGQPFSPDRKKLVFDARGLPSEPISIGQLEIFDLEKGMTISPDLLEKPRELFWSPDGRYLAYVNRQEDADQLVIYELETGENQVILGLDFIMFTAGWSPSGREIAFVSTTGGQYDLYVIVLDTLEVRQITNTLDIESTAVWSPNKDKLLVGITPYTDHGLESWPFVVNSLYLMDVQGHSEHIGDYDFVLSSSLGWSSDGSYIAFSDAGRLCLHELGTKQTICPLEDAPQFNDFYAAYDAPPVWSPDNRWLAFRASGFEDSNCQGVYVLEIETRKTVVVDEGSCKAGPLYWIWK